LFASQVATEIDHRAATLVLAGKKNQGQGTLPWKGVLIWSPLKTISDSAPHKPRQDSRETYRRLPQRLCGVVLCWLQPCHRNSDRREREERSVPPPGPRGPDLRPIAFPTFSKRKWLSRSHTPLVSEAHAEQCRICLIFSFPKAEVQRMVLSSRTQTRPRLPKATPKASS
jgi:hypothetical protein